MSDRLKTSSVQLDGVISRLRETVAEAIALSRVRGSQDAELRCLVEQLEHRLDALAIAFRGRTTH